MLARILPIDSEASFSVTLGNRIVGGRIANLGSCCCCCSDMQLAWLPLSKDDEGDKANHKCLGIHDKVGVLIAGAWHSCEINMRNSLRDRKILG